MDKCLDVKPIQSAQLSIIMEREVMSKQKQLLHRLFHAVGLFLILIVSGCETQIPPHDEEAYDALVRQGVSVGVGRGDVARLSVVWLPSANEQALTPIHMRLVFFDITGKTLVSKEVRLAPGKGDFVDFRPSSEDRHQLWGYVWIEGFAGNRKRYSGVFGGLEVFDKSTGRSRLRAPVGLG